MRRFNKLSALRHRQTLAFRPISTAIGSSTKEKKEGGTITRSKSPVCSVTRLSAIRWWYLGGAVFAFRRTSEDVELSVTGTWRTLVDVDTTQVNVDATGSPVETQTNGILSISDVVDRI